MTQSLEKQLEKSFFKRNLTALLFGGVSIISSSTMIYNAINYASKGEYEGSVLLGALSVITAFAGGYGTKNYWKKR
tara:strand:- start:165 stop:392 length:228 start_codon:yes stop_codon:yes gene_type:complete